MSSLKDWTFKFAQRNSFDRLSESIIIYFQPIFPAITFKDKVNDELLREVLLSGHSCKILDVGCGYGRYIYRILEFFVQDVDVIGVDISRKMMRLALEIAKKKNLKSKVSYVVCDAENLPFRDTSFDLILCYDLLEHLPNPSLCIKEFGRILLKGGHVIIYTLNRNYKYTFDWLLERIFYKWLQKRRIKVGHFPEKYLNINELNSMLSKNHMYSVKIIPMHCFVTGIWDIYILPLISNLKYRKKENGKRESAIKSANSFQRLIKFLIAYISYALKIFSLMDRPLEKRFLSAGFFIFSYKIDN